jgi:hypothetical protein
MIPPIDTNDVVVADNFRRKSGGRKIHHQNALLARAVDEQDLVVPRPLSSANVGANVLHA